MEFDTPLTEARLISRYKRFLADIELPGGRVITAHCPNPGSMRTCAPDDARVWVWRSDNPRRKLQYTWELVEADGGMVVVNTARGNQVVAEALANQLIPELAGYDEVRREVAYGQRSRVDFLLTRGEELCYVEVKSVTLNAGGNVSAFPDSVTTRGTRHLQELMAMVDEGHRAVLLFCVGRDPTERVRPADEIDPTYGRTLRSAQAKGVEILAYKCAVTPRAITLGTRVPVDLAVRSASV